MYGEIDYSTNLYHWTDETGRPVMLRNDTDTIFDVPMGVDYDPRTLLQVVESEFTQVPRSRLHQQNASMIRIDPRDMIYAPIMITEPARASEGGTVDTINLINMLNGVNGATQPNGRLSLYVKDLGLARAIRFTSDVSGYTAIPRNSNNFIPRYHEMVYLTESVYVSNKQKWNELYQLAMKALPGVSVTAIHYIGWWDIRQLFVRISRLNELPFWSLLPEARSEAVIQYSTPFGDSGYITNEPFDSIHGDRGPLFGKYGIVLRQLEPQIKVLPRETMFHLWLYLPKPFNNREVDNNYESVLFGMAAYVLTGQWGTPEQYRQPNIVAGTPFEGDLTGKGVEVAVTKAVELVIAGIKGIAKEIVTDNPQ